MENPKSTIRLCLLLLLLLPVHLGCGASGTTPNDNPDNSPLPNKNPLPGNKQLPHGQPLLLLFTKTAGFRHASIPAGVTALKALAAANKMSLQHTEDASVFSATGLEGVDVVIFLNTTGDILNADQEDELRNFIRSGGGFVGVHAAADTEHGWPWYGRLVGAYFASHPAVQEARIQVAEQHPATEHLSSSWFRTDEWYNFRDLSPFMNVLLWLDEQSYEGGTMGEEHPIAWFQIFDGGRSFYTGLGHTIASYQEQGFLQHLLGGIEWALDR